ncbi:NADPH2:quinone reductase [Promicromonospora sp. AC04]|uniref:alcohol dehydrogenase catalytic domain-containing protein n=1 Tax=Promicromonospora sp. AC04 TaxID=2135723 RepID=UPI000D34624D|nr:zinc-binding dehydrogenase [Promicromonospora sp. AC04]PUB26075.1 NADPH2:quinone reductase [Promicromonospora sp. AC04]
MDAIRHHSFGPPEVLTLEQIPDPVPGPGEVLVDAVAHGVHLLDTSIRRGEAGPPLPLPSLPTVPGREIAGTVAEVGPGVDASWTGRRVAAHLGAVPDGGGYARRVVVAAEKLHAIPDGPDGAPLDPADAIAMIGTGRMAVYTLDIAAVTAADVVVVTGAAGGLGPLFVQEALRSGARVVALAGGAAKLKILQDLVPDALPDVSPDAPIDAPTDTLPATSTDTLSGSDRLTLVDYSEPGWLDTARAALGPSPATLVFDGVGGELGTAATSLMDAALLNTTPPDKTLSDATAQDATVLDMAGSRLVAYGWASGAPNRYTSWAGADRIESPIEVRYAVGPDAPPMPDQRPYQERALAQAASGRWRVATHRVPFAEAARAHRELEERRTTGKVVLV